MAKSVQISSISAQDTWSLRHQVMWPNRDVDYVKLPKDNEGLHYGLWIDEDLTSVISLFIQNNEAQFRKFATSVAFQGNGYGSKLLHFVMEKVQAKGLNRIWCNARQDKTSYYAKFGMHETNQYFEKGGIDYVVMERFFKVEEAVVSNQ